MKQLYNIMGIVLLLISCNNTSNHNFTSINEKLKNELLKIDSLQQENNYIKANKTLNNLIERYPNNAELYFRLAHSKTLSEPNLFEIMYHLNRCLELDTTHAKAKYLKSQGLMFSNDFNDALNLENNLIAEYPNLFLLKMDRASTYLFNGNFETAIKEASKLIPLTSNRDELERLYRIKIYSNYFLDNFEQAKKETLIIESLGFDVNYINEMINNKSKNFETFAVGSNVGNNPCTLSQLEFMFP